MAAVLATGCSAKGGVRALPPGTYRVDAPSCASTGQPPAYPDPSFKLGLFAFDALSSHTLTIGPYVIVETYQGAGCQLMATRGLAQNADGRYTTERGGRFAFAPDGCSLSLVVGGVAYPAGPAYTSAFQPSDDTGAGVPFAVSASADGYTLQSADTPALDAVWGAYGCATPDRLQIGLHRG